MEFCSKYGYDYGFSGSDSDDYEETDHATSRIIHRKIRMTDVNIIAAKFDQLINPNEMFAGEPKMCIKCAAVMCHLSAAQIMKRKTQKC
jgi:hypothetical protein